MSGPASFQWDETRKGRVIAMLDEGKSRAEIASHIGVTRNAVCGMIVRMGARAERFHRQKAAPKPPPRAEPAPPRAPIVCEPAPEGGLTIVELRRHQCRWPSGDPRDLDTFRYCGATRAAEGPYCARHHALSVGRYYSAAERAAYAATRPRTSLPPTAV